MYFALLPPEINSGNMYAGAGSGPMLSAATAWERLAAELQATAAQYSAVTTGLTGESWTGPSAEAMAAAAAQYAEWLSTTAATAGQAGAQAQAAAAAYQAAYAATVPPELVAANRSQLQTLLATNLLGQNLAAITATEVEYMEMWAQDSAAMQTYAASASAATKVTPFTAAPQTTTATAGQAPTTAAAAASNGGILQFFADIATQYNTFVTNALTTLTGNPAAGSTLASIFTALKAPVGLTTQFNDTSLAINWPIGAAFKWGTPVGRVLADLPATGLGAGLRTSLSGGLSSAVTASVAESSTVGGLSVPTSWASATPAIRLAATAVPAAGMSAAPAMAMPSGLLSQAAMGSMVGGAAGSGAPRAVSGGRIRIQGGKAKAPVKLDAVIAKLQSQPEAVQHWNVEKEGLDDLLEQLAKKPGIHAVHLKGAKKTATPLG